MQSELDPLTNGGRRFHFIRSNKNQPAPDVDILDNAEDEMKSAGISIKSNANLALAKALRQHIQECSHSVKRSMICFRSADWVLFIVASVCLSIVAISDDYLLTPSFSLAQLLAILALATKSAEKFLNLSSLASTKTAQLKELEALIRRISVVQMQFYLELTEDNTENRKRVAAEIHEIWSLFSNIESNIFLAPVRVEEQVQKLRSVRAL